MPKKLDNDYSEFKFEASSLNPNSKLFDAKRYWRGPVWSVVNLLIYIGLKEEGHTKWANKVKDDTLKLIEEHGFSEYFSAIDGVGCGGGTFTWTASVYVYLIDEDKRS